MINFQKLFVLFIVILSVFTDFAVAADNQSFAKKLGIQEEVNNDGVSPGRNIGGKNILLSLLLPGLGEWVAGESGRAKIFLGVEAALWASYFGSREYANVIRRDYHTFAAVHAEVDTRNKDAQYWIDIGNSPGIYEFNETRRIERNLDATYPENGHYFWLWDNQKNRIEYTELRDKEDNWKQVATFMIGGMVLNRIVSTIDVIRLIRKNKKSKSDEIGTRQDRRYSYLHWSYENSRLRGEVVQLYFTMKF